MTNDVLEAISAIQKVVPILQPSDALQRAIRKLPTLALSSQETSIRDAARAAFRSLFLGRRKEDRGDEQTAGEAADGGDWTNDATLLAQRMVDDLPGENEQTVKAFQELLKSDAGNGDFLARLCASIVAHMASADVVAKWQVVYALNLLPNSARMAIRARLPALLSEAIEISLDQPYELWFALVTELVKLCYKVNVTVVVLLDAFFSNSFGNTHRSGCPKCLHRIRSRPSAFPTAIRFSSGLHGFSSWASSLDRISCRATAHWRTRSLRQSVSCVRVLTRPTRSRYST